jgi:3-oxoacyl-[acyl-carrier-protein] synthase-3
VGRADRRGKFQAGARRRWIVASDISCWLLHQANVRILDAAIEALEIDRERVVMHMARYGNTSAGTIPLALDESLRGGAIRRGDYLLMSGFGAGLTWGTAVWRW